jgi:hypothetical protein
MLPLTLTALTAFALGAWVGVRVALWVWQGRVMVAGWCAAMKTNGGQRWEQRSESSSRQ